MTLVFLLNLVFPPCNVFKDGIHKRNFDKSLKNFWQLAIHSRGFFSDLRFPSRIGLDSGLLSTAETVVNGVSLPF
jgi:hypothetical protein